MRDHKSAEEIPQHVERGGDDGGHIVVGRHRGSHHAVEGEIQHGEVHKKDVPQKF